VPDISSAFLLNIGSQSYRIKEGIKLTEHNKAAAEFRCAFTNEIRLIEESTVDNDIQQRVYSALQRSYSLPGLPQRERQSRDKKTWDNHCYPQELDEYERTLPSAKFIHYDDSQGVEIVEGKLRISEEHEKAFNRVKKPFDKKLGFHFSLCKI
jgi:hypothetical protein